MPYNLQLLKSYLRHMNPHSRTLPGLITCMTFSEVKTATSLRRNKKGDQRTDIFSPELPSGPEAPKGRPREPKRTPKAPFYVPWVSLGTSLG